MKKVEVLKEFKYGIDTYYVGEIAVVDDSLADFWCRAGWVKDTDGIIPTGTPKESDIILEVADISQVTLNEVV